MSEQLYDFFGAMFHRYFRPPSTHIREWVDTRRQVAYAPATLIGPPAHCDGRKVPSSRAQAGNPWHRGAGQYTKLVSGLIG